MDLMICENKLISSDIGKIHTSSFISSHLAKYNLFSTLYSYIAFSQCNLVVKKLKETGRNIIFSNYKPNSDEIYIH